VGAPEGAGVKFIGLLLVNEEDDILAETLPHHEQIVDVFYALDGTADNTYSRATLEASAKCGGYSRDADLPRPPYPDRACCGYRKWIHEQAVADHGPDNWFVLLHADEVWTTTPQAVAEQHPHAGAVCFRLPFYVPYAGEPWDDTKTAVEQLRWRLGPGWPEWRMFRGSEGVEYRPDQYMNTLPSFYRGWGVKTDCEIRHYPYRSPASQTVRAATTFDPDNYAHVLEGAVYWTDDMIAAYQAKPDGHFAELTCAG